VADSRHPLWNRVWLHVEARLYIFMYCWVVTQYFVDEIASVGLLFYITCVWCLLILCYCTYFSIAPNRQTFKCPYCSAKNLDCQGLIRHCTEGHYADRRPVVSLNFCLSFGVRNCYSNIVINWRSCVSWVL